MPMHILDCVRRPASGAVAVRIILEVGLKDGFQHELGGGLNHAIPDSGNAERTLASPLLRYHHPLHRIGPVRLRDQFLAQACQPCLQAPFLDLLEAHPVHTRSPRIAACELVSVQQDVLATDLVVEHIEAEGRLRLRLAIELPLKAPDFIWRYQAHRQSPSLTIFESAPEVRVLRSSGITRPQRSNDPVRLPLQPPPEATLRPLLSPQTGLPLQPRTTLPTCRAHYPGGPSGCACRLLPRSCSLPHMAGGSASALSLSRPAQALLALRPAESLNRPRRPLSRGFDPASCPATSLVSFRTYRQLSGWSPPPLVIRAFRAHCQLPTHAPQQAPWSGCSKSTDSGERQYVRLRQPLNESEIRARRAEVDVIPIFASPAVKGFAHDGWEYVYLGNRQPQPDRIALREKDIVTDSAHPCA